MTRRQTIRSLFLGSGLFPALVSELLESNAAFQALVAKSKAGPRKPFVAAKPPV